MSDLSRDVILAAALQLAPKPGDTDGNRRRYIDAVRALDRRTRLIVTPELAISGYDLTLIDQRREALAEPLDGPSVAATVDLARTVPSTIVLGLLERRDHGGLYDTAVIVTPEGDITAYRKSHLYPAEASRFAAGDELRTVETPAGRLGPLICFEHAFPAIATTLAVDGAQILVIPSAVAIGYEHLLSLRSRARAQDNQVFAIACNQAGSGFCGNSLIVDPRGEVLARAGTAATTVYATLDLSATAREREQEPALRLHRPALYRTVVQDVDA
jgi:predicted amidohydrolase